MKQQPKLLGAAAAAAAAAETVVSCTARLKGIPPGGETLEYGGLPNILKDMATDCCSGEARQPPVTFVLQAPSSMQAVNWHTLVHTSGRVASIGRQTKKKFGCSAALPARLLLQVEAHTHGTCHMSRLPRLDIFPKTTPTNHQPYAAAVSFWSPA